MAAITEEGIGLVLTGPEENYLVLIGEDGSQRTVSMSDLVPRDGTTPWNHFEALTGGFGEYSAKKLKALRAEGQDMPRAHRLRITVESEPLTHAETEELLHKVKAKNEA